MAVFLPKYNPNIARVKSAISREKEYARPIGIPHQNIPASIEE
jgi:hypothetical protein